MKILRTPNAGGKWIAVQRGLLERGRSSPLRRHGGSEATRPLRSHQSANLQVLWSYRPAQ